MPAPVFKSSKSMPASLDDSPSKVPARVSTTSALLVETRSVTITVVKEYNTENIYAITPVEQDIMIDARGKLPTTESLAAVLQTTITTTSRKPLVIPGTNRRANGARTQELYRSRYLSLPLRHGIPLGAVAVFILFSLFSFNSLADRYADLPIIGNAVQWVHHEPLNWALLVGDHAPVTQTGTPQVIDPGPGILPSSDYVAIARQAAASAGIPPEYFVRQINEESSFNPNAVSPAGAVGIAQFLPSTAASLGINPYDPVSSLYGAARYMAQLDNSYAGDYAKALAAYNAGPPAVTHAVNSGGSNWLAYMPLETQHYVHVVVG